MDVTSTGVVVGVIGLMLTAWSLWYARSQSRLTQSIQRNEMISFWAHLDRIRVLLWDIEKITQDEQLREDPVLALSQVGNLRSIHKGLSDEYVRIAEMIVKKMPSISMDTVDYWKEKGKLTTDWQRQQFINLIADQPEDEEKRAPGWLEMLRSSLWGRRE